MEYPDHAQATFDVIDPVLAEFGGHDFQDHLRVEEEDLRAQLTADYRWEGALSNDEIAEAVDTRIRQWRSDNGLGGELEPDREVDLRRPHVRHPNRYGLTADTYGGDPDDEPVDVAPDYNIDDDGPDDPEDCLGECDITTCQKRHLGV